MTQISLGCQLLLLACVVGVSFAIYDPSNAGIKTKIVRRDPIIAQALEQQQQSIQRNYHTLPGPTVTTTTNAKTAIPNADERLSPTTHNQYQLHATHQAKDAGQQQQEVPLYQERHGPAVNSDWKDVENAITEYYTGCPTQHTGPLPYAYDCRRYLNCWRGRGHIQTCAPGTVFNPDTLECDHPEKVVCGSLLALGNTQATKRTARYRSQQQYGNSYDAATNNVNQLCPSGVTGMHPHPTDCTKFLNCANGNGYILDCGPGTAYSIPMQVCDYKHKVDCSGREGGVASTRLTHGSSRQLFIGEEIVCPSGVIHLHPHPHDCTKFLNCAHGKAVVQDCGPGTAFDSEKLVCDYKDKVHCGSGLSGEFSISTNTQQKMVDILCPANVSGLFAHPFDYTKFLNCRKGQTAIQSCMPGLIFSITKRFCQAKDMIVYTDHVTYIVSEVSYEYSQRLNSCPPGTDGIHLYPFDCEKYIKCINGQMMIMPCAPGQVFSISKRACFSNQHVSSTDRVLYYRELFEELFMTKSNYDQSTSHTFNQAKSSYMLQCPRGSTGLFPYPFDATKYLRCDAANEKLVVETCVSGNVFSLSRKYCHLREEVRPTDMIQVQTSSSYTEEWDWQGTYGYNAEGQNVLYLMCPPQLSGLFLHPFDCTKYIQCGTGEAKILSCPHGTVLSISRRQCVARDQVEAYDRVEYFTETQHEFYKEFDHSLQHSGTDMLSLCASDPNALHPYANDPTKYIRCTDARTVVDSCPSGMIFSVSRKRCDTEARVQTSDRSTYSRHQTHGDIRCPTGVSGFYAHPTDCTKYLNCDNGVTNIISCGPGTAWDPRMQVCDMQEKVNCMGRVTTGQLYSEFALHRQHVTCPDGINGFYPHPFDYTKYVICQDGRTVLQKCLEDKVFSLATRKCVPYSEVSKSDHVSQADASTWSQTGSANTANQFHIECPGNATGTYVFPFDCTKFIKCENGHTSLESCAHGKAFSMSQRWCLPENQIQPTDRVTFVTETQNLYSWESKYGRASDNIVCPMGLNGLYQHPYDWTKYLNCTNGRTVIESCGPGKVFSVSKRLCRRERDVNSNDRCNKGVALQQFEYDAIHNLATTSITGTQGEFSFCAPDESGAKAHPYDCTKFINCANGATNIQDCGPGTAWNKQMQVCDHKQNVDCSDRTGADTWGSSQGSGFQTKGAVNAKTVCPEGALGTYPYPQDCTKFLNCGNGVAYIQACASGTAFNAFLRVCDYIDNVDCSAQRNFDWTTQDLYSQTHRDGKSYGYTGSQNHQWGISQAGTSGGSWSHHQQPQGHLQPSISQSTTHVTQTYYPQEQGQGQGQGHYYGGVGGTLVAGGGTGAGAGFVSGSTDSSYSNTISTTGQTGYNDRWSNMGVARPTVNSYGQSAGVPNSGYATSTDTTWSGSGSSIQHVAPSSSVIWEEGSLQPNVPNRNFIHTEKTYSVPLAPFASDTNTRVKTTTTNVYYAKPVSSSEDTEETFNSRNTQTTYTRVPVVTGQNPYYSQQNYSREVNYGSGTGNWQTMSRPVPLPNSDLMPPHREGSQTTVTNQQNGFVHRQLMPPYPDNAPTTYQQEGGVLPNQQLMPPYQEYPGTLPYQPGSAPNTPSTHLMPPMRTDRGQQPLEEPAFRGQPDISSYDQYPSTSQTSKTVITSSSHIQNNQNHRPLYPTPLNSVPATTITDESNLFGGLQPPMPTSQYPVDTTPATYLQPPIDSTSPLPFDYTHRRTKEQVFHNYPHLSNATVQQFSRDPHYSPSYSGVAHSHNTTWERTATRMYPPNTGIKGGINPPSTYNTQSINTFSETVPPQRSLSPPDFNADYYPRTRATGDESNFDGKELPISDALRMLLRPYFNRSGTVSKDSAKQAESYIMNLAATTTTSQPTHSTTTPKPLSATNAKEADVELILAGEQPSLSTVPSRGGGNPDHTPYHAHRPHRHGSGFEHSKDFHCNHPNVPNPFATSGQSNPCSNSDSDPEVGLEQTRHHGRVHGHNHHHEHSVEFHKKHPHLPNPFGSKDNPDIDKRVVDIDDDELPHPNAEPTTAPTIDLRSSGRNFKDRDCQFDCGNGKCIKNTELCDGVNNCGNRKDESNCDMLGYEVRLTGGETPNMGRIEVKILGKWGYVCDDQFGLRDADVVCREMGFKLGASEVRGNSFYSPTEVNFSYAMDDVNCRGNETKLKDCDFLGWGVSNCGADEVVGVVCKVPLLKCPNNHWLCTTSQECIPASFVCDNTADCADKSDESESVCNSAIEFRLEGGRDTHEGRLEVKYRGEWGTVCDDDFGLKEAQVVCNSFGFYGPATVEKNIYGPGNGPIWLDQVSCIGNETSIDKCSHNSWGEHNCNHTEDVSIRCTAGPPPRKTSSKGDDRQQSTSEEELLALEDIGVYASQQERSSKFLGSQRRCGHFKHDLEDEFAHPEERVVNGSVARRGRHPWQATIRTRGRGGISSHWCGAVLISKKHLLTAAHCLAGYSKGGYFIRMGDHYANIAESSEVDSFIENWYIHEKFRDKTHMNNDIALIVLKNPVRFNDYIQPICLPEKGASIRENRLCTISGWGSIKSGVSTPSNILRAAQLPLLSDAVCTQSHVYGSSMTEGMFCAGYMDESVDACDGDSGGPLVCSENDGETLFGIISWGQHCGYANKPGVYVRVEKYIDWIYEKINFSMQQSNN